MSRPGEARGPLDRRLLDAVPELRRRLALSGAASAAAAVLTVAQAVLLAHVVDAVFLRHAGLQAVGADLGGVAGVLAAKATVAGALELNSAAASAEVRGRLRARLLDAVVSLGPRWLGGREPGRVVTAAGPGIESLDAYVTRALPAVVSAGIVPVVCLGAIGVADWPSLLLLVATLPLVPVFLALVGVTTRRRMDRQWATLSRLSGQFLDLLQGLTTLKIYGRSNAQVGAVREGTERYRRQTLATLKTAFVSGLVLDLLATLSVALVAVTVGLRLDHGHLSFGRALVVLLLAPEVYAPLRAAGAQHHASEAARSVVDTCSAVFDEAGPRGHRRESTGQARLAPPSSPTVGPCDPDGAHGDQRAVIARFESVELTYPGRSVPALIGVHLAVPTGRIMVLSGPSGAGKSSLLALLLGFLAPTAGHVRVGLDGGDVPTGPAGTVWRRHLAWVPQRPRCTQATVGDEIRLGDPDIPGAQLDEILALCQAPTATVALGEDGGWLSAGQRRRVALARAVARARAVSRAGAHPVVLLDEPSEDLDARTEQVVAAVISALAGQATVVIATHSAVLRSLADVEVVVDRGHVTSAPGTAARVAATPSPAPPPSSGWPATPLTTRGSAQAHLSGLSLLGPAVRDTPAARRSLLLAAVFGGLAGLSGVALTATSVWLICRAAQHPNVQALALAVVGVRTFALTKAACRYLERLTAHDGALRLLAGVRARVFAALEPLAPAGLGRFRRGDLLGRFITDVDGAQEALIRAAVPLAGAAVTVLGSVILIGQVDQPGALVLAAGAVVAGAVTPYLAQRGAGDRTTRSAVAGRRDELITGLLDGLDELVAYDGADCRVAQIAAADDILGRADRRAARAGAVAVTAAGVAGAVTVAGVLATIVPAITAGRVSAIWVGVVAVTALVALDAVNGLPSAYAALGRYLAGLQRVDDILAAPAPLAEPAAPLSPPQGGVAIEVRSLTLAPAVGAPPIIEAGSLVVRPNERVALIGPSGSGKSSLLAAMLRLLPARGGIIDLCPADPTDPAGQRVPVAELRAQDMPPLVAGSLQGDHVFAATLRDNLKVVKPGATDVNLDSVAARVGLDGWISTLPDGWSTQAGPDGSALSGGQRQRLLLARALLADPQVLVLDEPTAHVDSGIEAAILADLLAGTEDHTLVMATHRRAGLETVDHVVQITDGTITPSPAPWPFCQSPPMAVEPRPRAHVSPAAVPTSAPRGDPRMVAAGPRDLWLYPPLGRAGHMTSMDILVCESLPGSAMEVTAATRGPAQDRVGDHRSPRLPPAPGRT